MVVEWRAIEFTSWWEEHKATCARVKGWGTGRPLGPASSLLHIPTPKHFQPSHIEVWSLLFENSNEKSACARYKWGWPSFWLQLEPESQWEGGRIQNCQDRVKWEDRTRPQHEEKENSIVQQPYREASKPSGHKARRPTCQLMLYAVICLEERIHENHSGITPIFATLFIPTTLLKVMPVSDSPGKVAFFLFCVIISTLLLQH